MQKRWRLGGGRLAVMMMLLLLCLARPGLAQVQPEAEIKLEPILRVSIADFQVQGERKPEAVREAFTTVLPAVVDCLQAEQDRAGKAPRRVMLRYNLGSNGKIVWCKVVDPPLKSLEACICKILPQTQMPAEGTKMTRVTVILEVRLDHLLGP